MRATLHSGSIRWSVTVTLIVLLVVSGTVSTAARPPRDVEPVPENLFAPVRLTDEGPDATPSPKPTPRPTPKPTPRPAVPTVPTGTSAQSVALAKAYAQSVLGAQQFDCVEQLWAHESGWRWNALNRSSGAYGIPQALPGSKMQSAGSDWQTNPVTQVRWGLSYIGARYHDPCNAWLFFRQHGWY